MIRSFAYIIISILSIGCTAQPEQHDDKRITVGAERMDIYLPLLQGKRVGLLINQTATIGSTHLLDTLLARNVDVRMIFGPEHGFRGDHIRGANVKSGIDQKTGLPVHSMHGITKKAGSEQLQDLDVVIFDIQDVGARFYTYISTMHYMMEACAKNNVQLIVLDRPNPNGHYVDGPIRTPEAKSFIGMHPIPIVHGMTVGELSKMIVGENWMDSENQLNLTVVKMDNWDHQTHYSLPIAPSPNLPNDQSIALYPSLCLFEQTNISVGRGTPYPFQIYGLPDSTFGDYTFTPVSIPGKSTSPKHQDKMCFGIDLRDVGRPNKIDLTYLIKAYKLSSDKESFFSKYFYRLAGTKELEKQIKAGLTEPQIRDSWSEELKDFEEARKAYLLYNE